MQLASRSTEPDHGASPTVSAALIDSLFEASGTVLTGIVFSSFSATLTALKTGQALIWAFVPLLLLTGAFRAIDLRQYHACKSTLTAEQATQWQKRYRVGAMIQAAVIGLWCSISLLSNDDAVVHMISLSVTTGIVAGAAGRAYGRQSIFRLQAVIMFGPPVVALALRGTPYYIAMSIVSAAFLLAIIQLSANLHRIFMRAVVAREREAALAGQFDTALNNMPHGLCMFRADGSLAVMNHSFSEMMKLSEEMIDGQTNASQIVDACVVAGSISAASGKIILAEIEDSQARDIITTDPDVARGRSLSWTFQPMSGGGAV
ncbi:MAG: PAS-domain containing protein, partial [Bradyrhizobium sp.]|nr:PAS-domain containing protein [Bradyrhizobium sp.]